MSFAARSMFRAIIIFPASSGSDVTSPRYRSGASATNPSSANASAVSVIWSFRPHHSWMTTTPAPCPAAGTAR